MSATFNTNNNSYLGNLTAEAISNFHILILGAGATGSNLADTLARMGFKLSVVDFDRVEERNIGTQVYTMRDIGVLKVRALRTHIYDATRQQIGILEKKLDKRNIVRLLRKIKNVDLIVDAFDNAEARHLICDNNVKDIPLLHIGLASDYGEIIWDDLPYVVPADSKLAIDVCEYPLARNTVMLAVTVAAQSIVTYVAEGGTSESWRFSLGDINVRRAW